MIPPDVRFVVPGAPRPWQRAGERIAKSRSGKQFIHHYVTKETETQESAMRLFASQAMQGRPPLEGPLDFQLAVFLAVPPSWSIKKQEAALRGELYPTGRPDLDNFAKLKDALKGIVWIDDSQVTDEHGWKRYSAEPRLVVEVRRKHI